MFRNTIGSRLGSVLLVAALAAWAARSRAQAPSRPDGQAAKTSLDEAAARQAPLLKKLNVAGAWEITRGDPRVVVGVIDNGFDFYHPDLKGRVEPGYYFPGGYHSEFFEGISHGTIVAGLIVAAGDRPGSITGLAPGCRVLAASQGMIDHKMQKFEAEFFRTRPKATFKEYQVAFLLNGLSMARFGKDWAAYQMVGATAAIRYLVDHGVRVINFSGGLLRRFSPSQQVWNDLEAACEYAASKGVVLVISAGNTGEKWEDYPGRPETVIIAGATRLDDSRWEEEVEYHGSKIKQGSCFGKRLTVMAPIEGLVVCAPHEPRFYESDDGPMGATKVEFKGPHDVLRIGATSSAAPIVSSLAALVLSARPDLDARAVVELIVQSADDLGPPGFDELTGHGRINFARTLRLARDRGR